MEQHELLIRQFYTAFQKRDFAAMQECYHAEASFHDPVFQDLNAKQVRAMWQMLLTSSKDLKVSFSDIHIAGDTGTCTWEAWYTFSKTGKPVHNVINASFQFRDGKILQHHDSFDLWRWSKQALGLSGLLLGWSPMVQNKIRATAKHSLAKFMSAS